MKSVSKNLAMTYLLAVWPKQPGTGAHLVQLNNL